MENTQPLKKISVTFLSSYLYCARKLYFEQVLKIIKIPKEAVVNGTIRHETYEGINNAEEALVSNIRQNQGYDEIFNEYKRVYTQILNDVIIKNENKILEANIDKNEILKKTLPLILEEAKIHSTNVHFFARKTNLFGKDLWQALTPKIKSEVRVESDVLGLKGIVDEIRVYENEIVPIELKTGKAPKSGVWEGHRIQIGAYIILLEEKNESRIKEGVVKYLDYNVERQISFDPFLKKEIIELVDKVRKLLNSNILPPKCDNKNKCPSCQLLEECSTRA